MEVLPRLSPLVAGPELASIFAALVEACRPGQPALHQHLALVGITLFATLSNKLFDHYFAKNSVLAVHIADIVSLASWEKFNLWTAATCKKFGFLPLPVGLQDSSNGLLPTTLESAYMLLCELSKSQVDRELFTPPILLQNTVAIVAKKSDFLTRQYGVSEKVVNDILVKLYRFLSNIVLAGGGSHGGPRNTRLEKTKAALLALDVVPTVYKRVVEAVPCATITSPNNPRALLPEFVAHAIRFLSTISVSADAKETEESRERIARLKPSFFREALCWLDSPDPRVAFVAAGFYGNAYPADTPGDKLSPTIAACKPRLRQALQRLMSWKLDKSMLVLPSAWLFGDEGQHSRATFVHNFHQRLTYMSMRATFFPSMLGATNSMAMCTLPSPFPSAPPYEIDWNAGHISDDRCAQTKRDVNVRELYEAEQLLARTFQAHTPTERIRLAHACIKVRILCYAKHLCDNRKYNSNNQASMGRLADPYNVIAEEWRYTHHRSHICA
jgi:hypothetical protein